MIAPCGACGAPIRVVATTSCAKLKLDPDPVDDGDVQIGEIAGVEVAVRPDSHYLTAAKELGIPLYRTHVRTCPATVREQTGPIERFRAEVRPARPHPFRKRGEETT